MEENKNGTQEQPEQKKKKKSDVILTIALVVAIAVFCYAAYNLYHIYTEYRKGTNEYNSIEEMAVTERDPDSTEVAGPDAQPKPPIDVDFEKLKSINDDVIGWIYVDALPDISYPIVQGKDNQTYLHQTYEKNYNFAGTIFVDYENGRDFNDCNTLVYGHNMKNGSMFGHLKKFTEDEKLYNNDRYFWILTPDKNYRYEIISAYTTGVNSDTYTLFKGPGEEFEEYLKKIKSYSDIKTEDTELTIKDKIVTLSTCTGNESTRFVVQGKRVNAEDDGSGENAGSANSDAASVDSVTDGLYHQKYDFPPETILSHTFFLNHPEEFYKFYRDKMLCDTAKPNAAHLKLAELEKAGKLKAVITQNIDNLHQMAGSQKVLELHGSVYRNHCMRCGKSFDFAHMKHSTGVPRCECGGMIKPDVVLYEEGLDTNTIEESVRAISNAQILIIGGTSLAVYPAAGLIDYFRGEALVVINKSSTPRDRNADLLIKEPIGQVFSQIKVNQK